MRGFALDGGVALALNQDVSMRFAALLLALGLTATISAATPQVALPTLIVEDDDGRASLPIDSLRVHVLIRGHLARTTYDVAFRNELDRDLDGQFSFPLPADAEVSDLGLYFDGKLRHAVAVERAQARAAYEEIVHRRVDPALAEWSSSTRAFRFRVYPIPARGTKVVRIAYDQDLTSAPYELDLRGALPPGALALTIDSDAPVDRGDAFVRATHDPSGEIALAAWSPSDWNWYYSAPTRVYSEARTLPPASAVTLLYDVSSSAVQRDDDAVAEFLRRFLAMQRDGVRVTVVPFHVRVDPPFETNAPALDRRLAELPRAGATNVVSMLERLPAIVDASPADSRIVIVTDGIHTMGDARSLSRALDALRVDRPIAVVHASPSADDTVLARLGAWSIDLARTGASDAAAAAMRLPTRVRVSAHASRIRSVLPESVTVSTDVTTTVHARGPQRVSRLPVAFDGIRRDLVVRELSTDEERDLVRRSWARAALRELLERGASDAEVLAHGLRFHQLTPRTSLLVLETWRDYEAYGVPMPRELREQRDRELAEASRPRLRRGNDANQRDGWFGGWFVKGTVRFDEQPLPGATVELLVNGTPAFTTVTDAEGRYWITPRREPRAFTLRASLTGFDTITRSYPRGAAKGATIDLVMRMAAVAEAITVTAEAPSFNVDGMTTTAVSSLVRPSPVALADPLLAQLGDAPFDERMERIGAAVAHMQSLRSVEDRFRYYIAARSAIGGDKFFQAHSALAMHADAPELAVRALTDLVESYPDDAPTLRLIGRVLEGWGFGDLARTLFERALELSPRETQTWRELLLLAAKERRTADLDDLQRRFTEAKRDARMVQTERAIHAELQRSGDDRRIDEKSELQVEAMWDTNYSDVDLRVREPDGEVVAYDHTRSKHGGKLHDDVTSGFGPETYTIPHMESGSYEIVLDYYGEDDTSLGTALAHVIVYVRGERRDFFVPLAGEGEEVVVTRVTR